MTGFLRIVLLALLALPTAAQTQLDPGFLAQELRSPTSSLDQALQLADGSRIFVGAIRWADGTSIDHSLVKYLPSGQLDAVFNAQVAQYQFAATIVAEAPGSTLVVGLSEPGTFGAQTRYGMVRLLANGTLDPGFAPQPVTGPFSFGTMFLVQTDGKIVVGNDPARALNAARRTLARLNADGTPDTSFGTALPASFTDPSRSLYDPIMAICQQPDGKLLVAHAATGTSGPGSSTYQLVRLLPSGAADASFLYSGPVGARMTMALQPDGKLLVGTPNLSTRLLARVLPSGAVDFSFQAPADLTTGTTYDTNNPAAIQVQPDGRILVAGVAERAAAQNYAASSFVVRLLATGARDTSWQPPMYGDYQAYASRIQLLPNGQLLVAGLAKLYASATALPSAVGLLDPNGANVAGFAPVLEQGGQVLSIALQADGRIVAGGEFTEINGTPARNLARFNADGTLDAAFTANAAVLGGYVREIQLQADGKIVVGGQFISAGGQARFAVARLLPSGSCDPGFAPALSPNSVFNVQEANYVAIQPDGQVLASGSLLPTGGAAQSRPLVRFTAAGALDASFQPASFTNGNYVYPLLVQPDGKILTAGLDYSGGTIGSVTYESVTRLLPNGNLDPSFARTPTGRNGTDRPVQIWQLELYPNGRLLAGGSFSNYGSTVANNLIRLLPTGAPDASFTSPTTNFAVQATAIQPNDRILMAGVNYYGGGSNPPIIRLLGTGSFDGSFNRSQGPAYGSWVRKLLIQPDGGILVAGAFNTVAGQTRQGLVRLLDRNVLYVASRQTEAATSAYPVPTHGDLHLTLDATARPQQVQLLDALGRVVLTQSVSQPVMTVATAGLPAGTYLLRVRYATSSVTRRVVVE